MLSLHFPSARNVGKIEDSKGREKEISVEEEVVIGFF